MYIYLDESGDLGFDFSRVKTTAKFVVTLLCCHSPHARKDIEKAVRRTLKHLNKPRGKTRTIEELKGTSTNLETKCYFFRQIRRDDWKIYTIVLNKAKVDETLRTKRSRPRLYNYLARLILEKLPLESTDSNVHLIVDRSKNRAEIRDFNQYLKSQIEARLPLNTGFFIEHLTSHESKGLQAVDLFCWGVYRKYSVRDYDW